MPLLLCRHLDRRTEWKAVVNEESFTIGCSAEATLPLPDATIAPKEVLIKRRGERYLLRDLAEKGRVALGGTVTREALIRDGDRIRVGRVALVFFEDERQPAGQVDLYREALPTAVGPDPLVLPRPAPLALGAAGDDLFPEPPLIPRGAWVAIALLCLVFGFILGAILTGPQASFTQGTALSTPSPAASTARGGPAAPGRAAAMERAPEPPAPLTDASPGGESASSESLQAMYVEAPTPLTETLEALKTELKADVARLPLPAPGRFGLDSIADPFQSRLALFRLFIDLAGRPPTRGEVDEVLPLSHEERWRRASETAVREKQKLPPERAVEVAYERFLGRRPTPVEAAEVDGLITPERPAGLWVTALEEYRLPGRRRPRLGQLPAKSHLVDFLDRAPSSPAEVELVASALASPRGPSEVARALAYSPESRLAAAPPEAGDGVWWEEEHFRFLLRAPTASERQAIPGVLAGLEAAKQRSWLLLALSGIEEYKSY